jgi:uncharacterized protein
MQQSDVSALMINLAQILEEGVALQAEIAPEFLQLSQLESDSVGPVHIRGRLTKVAEQIYFQGTISGVMALPCSRCLETMQSNFVSEVRVVFLPPAAAAVSEGEESVTDELDIYVHDGMTIDLRPLVYDQVVLAFPIQPLCASDCAGLCQVCGGNRNEAPCTCQVESGDIRFALLKHMSFPQSL